MFKDYNPHQDFLLPPSARDFLPAGDLACVVVEIVSAFDIAPFQQRYHPLGPHAYHPKMMLGLLFYAYSQGVFSSRKIAERIRYDIRFMFVAGYQRPDFHTICDFRKHNLDLIAGYFKDIVRLCGQLGLVTWRTVAIDGSKLKANASSQRNKDRDALRQEIAAVEAEIARRLALAQAADDAEAEADDEPKRLDVADLQDLHAKLEAARDRLDDQPERKEINLTDPDSRVLQKVGSGYNPQLAVDATHDVIVAVDVTDEANDVHQLLPMIDRVEVLREARGDEITILADAGYASAQAFTELESRPHVRAYVPLREEVHRGGGEPPPFDKRRFRLDVASGRGVCPLGQPMRELRRGVNKSGQPYIHFVGEACSECSRRSECTTAKRRNVVVLQAEPALARMRARMKTALGSAAMAIRRSVVEPVIGILKAQLGFRQFSLRGLEQVKGEFHLLCGAYNLKKIARHLGGRSVRAAQLALQARSDAKLNLNLTPKGVQIVEFWRRFGLFKPSSAGAG